MAFDIMSLINGGNPRAGAQTVAGALTQPIFGAGADPTNPLQPSPGFQVARSPHAITAGAPSMLPGSGVTSSIPNPGTGMTNRDPGTGLAGPNWFTNYLNGKKSQVQASPLGHIIGAVAPKVMGNL